MATGRALKLVPVADRATPEPSLSCGSMRHVDVSKNGLDRGGHVVEDIPATTGSRFDDHSTWRKSCTCGGPGVTHIRAGTVHS
jgi:hypothetical protein